MNTKRIQSNTKSTQMRAGDEFTILIPELEEAMEQGKTGKFGRSWSDGEKSILKKYYGKVDTALILPHLPKRTIGQVQNQAGRMGLTGRKG
jgi:hypothetical protein